VESSVGILNVTDKVPLDVAVTVSIIAVPGIPLAIVMVKRFESVAPFASVTVAVKVFDVAPLARVPEIVPELDNDNPEGRSLAVVLQTYGVLPPDAVKVAE
jgi:hypothetical protein